MTFAFSQRSLNNLKGVHHDLVKVMEMALTITPLDFGIIEGRRSHERQKELVAAGKSKTMNSRHLTGKAVDFAVYVSGKITWDREPYVIVSGAIKRAAHGLGVPITWGGEWKTIVDCDHIELERHAYPDHPELLA